MKKYNLYSICSVLLLVVLLKQHPSKAQQPYVNNYQTNCNQDQNIMNGFKCNGVETCQSYLTFRPTPAYETPLSAGELLGATSSFADENNIFGAPQIINTDNQTIFQFIPVNCSCLGAEYYQHNSSYRLVRLDDSFFTIANDIYQGLTTCQALMHANPYATGETLNVPLWCACPTPSQTASGFKYLLTYMITSEDNLDAIAAIFREDKQSILDANELFEDSLIFPLTPLLVPLKSQPPVAISRDRILGCFGVDS